MIRCLHRRPHCHLKRQQRAKHCLMHMYMQQSTDHTTVHVDEYDIKARSSVERNQSIGLSQAER